MSDWSTQPSSAAIDTRPGPASGPALVGRPGGLPLVRRGWAPAPRRGPRDCRSGGASGAPGAGPSSGAAGHLRLAEGLEILVRVAHLALQGPLHEELVGEVADEAARELVFHLEGAVRAGPRRLVADR